jgi:citrate lyase subunit beta / citryl-CoA lyase
MRDIMQGTSATKGDCLVQLSGAGPLSIEVITKSPELLERGLREVTSETLIALELNQGKITISDNGALDYVIGARIEVEVREANPLLERLHPMRVHRTPTPRDAIRLTRLYTPGNNPKMLAGAELHGADAVLLDLEDSVPPSAKSSARVLVKHLLGAIDFPEVWVRINSMDQGGLEDLEEVMCCQPHGICLPKAENRSQLEALDALLADHEVANSLELGSTHIIPIIETPAGIFNVLEIAKASPRTIMLAFGAEDYTRALGAIRTNETLLMARSMIVAAAAAADIQSSDTVFSDLEDQAGLIAEASMARGMGFSGKGAINPRQLGPITKAFLPSKAELAQAMRVIEAALNAEAKGLGAVAVDGKMIDKPVLERARKLVRLSKRGAEVTL